LEEDSKVVGSKQTIRALEKNLVKVVYVANDANKQIRDQIIEKANNCQVEIIYVDTMKDLGKACDVEVQTATAAIIK
jgi:large subunit ribosomal protein L7A